LIWHLLSEDKYSLSYILF